MAEFSDEDRPDVEVFDPGAPRVHMPGGIEPVTRPKRRLPGWAKLAGVGAAVAALVVVAATAGTDSTGMDTPQSTSTSTVQGEIAEGEPRPPAAGGDAGGRFVDFLGVPDISIPVSTRSGTAGMWLPDGTIIQIGFPDAMGIESAEVSGVEGFVTVRGGEHCCTRPLFFYPGRLRSVVESSIPIVELHPGQPERGAVYGSQGRQLLVFRAGAGESILVVAASPARPFTPAELSLYRDTLEAVERPDGFLHLVASGPVEVWATRARIEATGNRQVSVQLFREPGLDCADPNPFAAQPVVACTDGRIVWSDTAGLSGEPDFSVHIAPPGQSVLGPLEGTLAGNGEANVNMVTADGILVVAGGEFSGAMIGVDSSTGAVIWHRSTTRSSFLSPFTHGGIVYAASLTGPVVAVDAATGNDIWTLPLARNESPRSFAVVGVSGTDPLLVIPSSVDDPTTVGSAVCAITATSGRVQWRLEFDGRRMQRWEPVAAAEMVVVGDVVSGVGTNRIYGIDAIFGVEQWRFDTELVGFRQTHLAPQLGPGGIVVVQSDENVVTALDIFDGTVLWDHDAPGLDAFTVAPDRQVRIAASGEETTLDIGTGEPVT